MRLTSRGRYAVMAMVDLARHGDGKPVRLADIAGREQISLAYLEQLFCKLRRAGLVRSVRGAAGGYVLARPGEEIRIDAVIEAVDAPIRATRCRPGSPLGCQRERARCATHELWDELGQHMRLFLGAVTLADVCAQRVRARARALRATPLRSDAA